MGLISPKGDWLLLAEAFDSNGFSLARYQRDRIFDFMNSAINGLFVSRHKRSDSAVYGFL